MTVDIRVPEVGESITEGILVEWLVEDGATVQTGAPLFELETDKITMTVEAAETGRLTIAVPAGETVAIGAVVGTLEASDRGGSLSKTPEGVAPQRGGGGGEGHGLSPAVRTLVAEHALDPAAIPGSGKDGRLTKGDVLENLETKVVQTRRRMSPLRQRIAERLVQAQHTAAMLTTFNEVDMTAVMALRARNQEEFVAQFGVKLGVMSFFVKAVVHALQGIPGLGARIEGDEFVQDNTFDIGVAVSSERGLVVPVIRGAHRRGFAEIEREIADLATAARKGRLTLEHLTGGVFTISNGGVFGSLLSTPILNPPQSGILGMHAIKRRPVAVGDSIEIRPMMYLALSYDHRVVDGREAVTFLKRIVTCLEAPEKMMLGVCDGGL